MKQILLLALLISSISFGQTGQIKGKITDENGELLPFCKIVLSQNGVQMGFAQSDFDGQYHLKEINPGTYDIDIKFLGYVPLRVEGVVVNQDKITFIDHQMKTAEMRIIGCGFTCGYHKSYSDEDREVGANK